MYAASMMAEGGADRTGDYDSFVQMTKTGPESSAGPRELKIDAPSTEDPDDMTTSRMRIRRIGRWTGRS